MIQEKKVTVNVSPKTIQEYHNAWQAKVSERDEEIAKLKKIVLEMRSLALSITCNCCDSDFTADEIVKISDQAGLK